MRDLFNLYYNKNAVEVIKIIINKKAIISFLNKGSEKEIIKIGTYNKNVNLDQAVISGDALMKKVYPCVQQITVAPGATVTFECLVKLPWWQRLLGAEEVKF